MDFHRQNISNYNLYDTAVDNMFIAEYMATAPGDYVKIYLLALMYADWRIPCTNDLLAESLSLPVEEVLLAWNHWEKLGLIRKRYKDPDNRLSYSVEFLRIREARFGRTPGFGGGEEPRAVAVDEERLAQLYRDVEAVTGRLFEGGELREIASWVGEDKVDPELILLVYRYCKEQRQTTRHRYVRAVLKDWLGQGLHSVSAVEAHLEDTDARRSLYRRVMKALGFTRNATEEERRIMDTWFDDMDYGLDRVLEACGKTSGISNPNLNYINSVLKAWKKEEGGLVLEGESAGQSLQRRVLALYEEERLANEEETRRRIEAIFAHLPRVEAIQQELREADYRLSKAMLMGVNGQTALRREETLIARLNQEKDQLLAEAGYSASAIEPVYTCADCRDTGTLPSGERCHCFGEKARELLETESDQ